MRPHGNFKTVKNSAVMKSELRNAVLNNYDVEDRLRVPCDEYAVEEPIDLKLATKKSSLLNVI